MERLEFYRNLEKYDATNFGLTIAPTLDCNFRCKYCFETHPKGKMSSETQAALIKFAESRLARAKNFLVTWYGGEPLLAKEIIWSLSEKFLELCAASSIYYKSFIVTNASLLEDSDAERFKKYKIKFAQITIDGVKEIHDLRRRTITGESTFDKLIDRVNLLLNENFSVVVRININKMAAYPAPRLDYCCVDYVNSFVVDNRGDIYRCWNHVGNLKNSCGNINDLNAEFGKNYLSWIQWNPIRHKKCRECAYLPICMGGCPDAMRNSDNGQPVCGSVKYNLDKVLSYYYEQLKGEVAD